MGSINKHISRYEITAVFTHPHATADVVLVHGLNGDPEKTWSSSHDGKSVFWPTDLLPQSLGRARANILVYGYNADVYTSGKGHRSASDNFISQHAQTLVTNLSLYRKSERTSGNPIIFIAHSLGGLLVKRALLYSNDVRDKSQEDARSIFISTYGIIFLGTPHTGSDMATWGLVLQRMADAIAPKKVFESESVLLKTLKRDNETLEIINSHFLDIYQRFKIHMAHENHKTDVKGTKMVVVDAKSASPQLPGVTYYGIEATHSGMCKFQNASAPGYRNVSTAIRDWVEEAPPVIRTRWDVELEDRRARAKTEAAERMHDYRQPTDALSLGIPTLPPSPNPFATVLSSDLLDDEFNIAKDLRTVHGTQVSSPTNNTSTRYYSPSGSVRELSASRPTFVHPDRFRPNSFFKGREEELQSLHRLLKDPSRRSEGTSAVLIQGIPGAGKTHLARQYVFNHKNDYPGGIYWIRSTTLQDMEDGFWRVAKTEAIKGMAAQEKKKDLLNPQNMVEIVKSWFNELENWLLVFDGIRFSDNAVLDFIPDRPNSSLIYTSTERAEPGAHRLDNPSIMKLGLLPVQDAQELLLEEMGKKHPYTTDDLRRAQDLVQLMGRLPLMIHAAALQMNATREPLAKYLKSFRGTPKVGILPAYKTIRDQLQSRGDIAALNLIYILSFFSQSMPVEMLALGLKALDKRTPVKTEMASHKRSLTHTFVTLINFALVERNETEDIPSSTSQSSRQSVELDPEPLDTIHVHSIVQAFFVQLLAEEGQLDFWLERAIRVFCRSFDEADTRINTDPDTGLPDDYRQYIRHGKKLMEHLDRHPHAHSDHKARLQINLQRDSLGDLISARIGLEERLAKLPGEIDDLQKAISTNIVDGKKASTHTSVFERINSVSSHSTDASSGANFSDPICPPEDVECESPLTFVDPNHFHMPYLSFPEDREPRTEDERSEDRTIIPYPPDVVEGLYPDTPEPEWTVVSRHRSVKRREQRRYHDRGGAWRETAAIANDARVSISRESARGLITPPQSSRGGRSPSRSRVTAMSEAEAELMHIKKGSPPPPRGGGYIYDKGRSSSVGTAAKPLSILGKSSYANIVSGTAVDDEASLSPTFSTPPSRAGTIDRAAAYDALSVNSLRTVDSASPSIAQRMKENRLPHTIDTRGQSRMSRLPAPQPSREAHPSRHLYLSSFFRRVTDSVGGTNRHSEPGKVKATPVSSKDSLETAPPVSQSAKKNYTMHHEGIRTANSSPGTQHTAFYPPGLSVATNKTSDLQHNPAGQQGAVTFQPPYPYHNGEPYSKVLSWSNLSLGHPGLNISSSATTVSRIPVEAGPPNGYSSQPMSRNPSSNPQTATVTGSTGTPVSSNSESIRSSLVRPRAPSLVETEPSPRLTPIDMDQTSYDVWRRRQNGRPLDGTLFQGSNAPNLLPMGRLPNFEVTRESPITSPRSVSGGESMARSGSGGIRLADGRIIEFGDLAVDVEEVDRRRNREDRERLQRRSEEAVEFSRQVRTGGVGESPPESSCIGLGVRLG